MKDSFITLAIDLSGSGLSSKSELELFSRLVDDIAFFLGRRFVDEKLVFNFSSLSSPAPLKRP